MSASASMEIRGHVSPRTAQDIVGVINRRGTNSSVAWIKWVGTHDPITKEQSDEFCLAVPPGRLGLPEELGRIREGTHSLGDIIYSINHDSERFYLSDRTN